MTRSSVKMCGLGQFGGETHVPFAVFANGSCTWPQEANGAEALKKI